jgi:hypothetical protein
MNTADTKVGKLVAKQLAEALGDKFAQRDGEARDAYIGRITKAAGKLAEDDWNGLSEPVQEWVNANAEALNKKTDLTDYEAQADEDDDDADEKPKAKAKATKVKATKVKATKADDEDEDEEADEDEDDEKPKAKAKATTTTTTKVKATRDSDAKAGGVEAMVKLIVKHPDWKKAKLMEELSKKDFTVSDGTANTVYYHTRNTIRVLKEMGKLGDD